MFKCTTPECTKEMTKWERVINIPTLLGSIGCIYMKLSRLEKRILNNYSFRPMPGPRLPRLKGKG